MYDLKNNYKSWPLTVVGIITILYSMLMYFEQIPPTFLAIMILQAIAWICGIVLIFSKL